MRWVIGGCLVLAAMSGGMIARADDPAVAKSPTAEADEAAEPNGVRRELLTGQVKFLGPALRDRGVKTYEEMDKQVVLVTDDGEFIPIVADWRGRAFYQDEHLRDRKVQLIVRRQPGIPYVQVLMVFTFDEEGRRMYTDYWCDICSFPMYEIKACDCCQGPVRLRYIERPLPSYITQELDREGKSPAPPKSETESATDDAK